MSVILRLSIVFDVFINLSGLGEPSKWRCSIFRWGYDERLC